MVLIALTIFQSPPIPLLEWHECTVFSLTKYNIIHATLSAILHNVIKGLTF